MNSGGRGCTSDPTSNEPSPLPLPPSLIKWCSTCNVSDVPREAEEGLTSSASRMPLNTPPAVMDEEQYSRPSVSYTHLRAHETPEHLVCRLLLEKKKKKKRKTNIECKLEMKK
eukprot:TRINITY_DN1948_c0_g1_i8.p1 TRINITY_DN1948_c0_g1~~TRINITY_DN1948_c0_g1_i8.p1  ORF type:complete len:113 (-),score=18.81 TRINITY_DN1948_c0_g1_i8:42-380(-)